MTDFNKSEVKLLSATAVDENILAEYYKTTFPHRKASLPKIWKWLNNSSFYKNEIPVVLMYDNKIIGHVGLRPLFLRIDEDKQLAGWPIDLRVDHKFRKHGLGRILTKKFTEYAIIHLGFLNDSSYPLFTKMGWKDGGKTYTHFMPIKPLDHPKFKRFLPTSFISFFNMILSPFFRYRYNKFKNNKYVVNKLTKEHIDEFINNRSFSDNKLDRKNIILPQRDEDFLNWRILNSPNINNYRFFSIEDTYAIILLNNNRGRYIDILSISSYFNNRLIINLIGSICYYALQNSYSYVRICSSLDSLNKILEKNFRSKKKKYNFCFYCKDIEKEKQILNKKWLWELIDSDFEYMEPKDSLYE